MFSINIRLQVWGFYYFASIKVLNISKLINGCCYVTEMYLSKKTLQS